MGLVRCDFVLLTTKQLALDPFFLTLHFVVSYLAWPLSSSICDAPPAVLRPPASTLSRSLAPLLHPAGPRILIPPLYFVDRDGFLLSF